MLLSGTAGSQGAQVMTKVAEPIFQAKRLAGTGSGGNTSAHRVTGTKEKAQGVQNCRSNGNGTSCAAPASLGLLCTSASISWGLSMCPLLQQLGWGWGSCPLPAPPQLPGGVLPRAQHTLRAGSRVAHGSSPWMCDVKKQVVVRRGKKRLSGPKKGDCYCCPWPLVRVLSWCLMLLPARENERE